MSEAIEAVPMSERKITEFDDLRIEIKKFKESNSAVEFDIAKPEGLKLAKAHIKTLKGIKKEVATTHKTVKESALNFGRQCDAVKRELTAGIDEMILVHEGPIKAAKEAEESRIAGLESSLASLHLPNPLPTSADELKALAASITTIEIGDNWQEYEEKAQKAREHSLSILNERIAEAEKNEENARKLKEMEQKEADRIAKEQADADKQAKEKRDAEIEEQRREREAKAIQDAKDAAAREERDRADREHQAKLEAESKRKADETHRQNIKNAIEGGFVEYGLTLAEAQIATGALMKGLIPHVSVEF